MARPDRAFEFWNGAALDADSTLTKELHGVKARDLAIQVKSDNAYSVDIEWLDGQGNTIRDETDIFGGGTGGNWNRTEQNAYSPHVKVEVNEDSSSSSTVDGTIYFR